MTLVLNGTTGVSAVDGSAATPAIQGNDTNTGVFFPAADTVAIATGGSERLRADSSGNVGIGTSSPTARLTVVTGSPGNNEGEIRISENATYYAGMRRVNATDEFRIGSYGASQNITFYTVSSERARITSGGDLLVGKTNASEANVGTAFGVGGDSYFTRSGSTNSNSTLHVYSTGAGAFRFYVGMGGTVYATSTTITAISDQRLKENIQDIDAGLAQVLALKPRKFDWKEGKGKNKKGDRGWIAQEFEQVFPDMIDEWRDPAPEGEEPYKAVNADLIPVLVKAIQELNAKVEAQAAEIAALKGAQA